MYQLARFDAYGVTRVQYAWSKSILAVFGVLKFVFFGSTDGGVLPTTSNRIVHSQILRCFAGLCGAQRMSVKTIRQYLQPERPARHREL